MVLNSGAVLKVVQERKRRANTLCSLLGTDWMSWSVKILLPVQEVLNPCNSGFWEMTLLGILACLPQALICAHQNPWLDPLQELGTGASPQQLNTRGEFSSNESPGMSFINPSFVPHLSEQV